MPAQRQRQPDRAAEPAQPGERGGGEPSVGAMAQERLVELAQQRRGIVAVQGQGAEAVAAQ